MAEDIGGGAGRDGKLCGTANLKIDAIYEIHSVPSPTDKDYLKKIESGEFFVKSEKTQKSFYENFMGCILNAYHKLFC